MSITNVELPDTSLAEYWISPDVFVYDGNLYRINLDFSIECIGKSNGHEAI